MTQVALLEAQQNLAYLVSLVQKGENVVIVEKGTPVAWLTPPATEPLPRRIPGIDVGVFTVPDDFDDPLPDDVLQGFGL